MPSQGGLLLLLLLLHECSGLCGQAGGGGSLRWMNGKIAAPEEEVTSSGPRNGFKL